MPAPRLAECDRVLVVEGFDDLLFYAELLESLGNDGRVFIKQMGGKGNLTSEALEAFLSPPLRAEKRAIGVIADADTSARGTAQSLASRLSAVTGQRVEVGAWTDGRPRTGLFVVPSATRAGEIESLVWEAWSNDPAHAAERACIEAYLACMSAAGHSAHSPDKGRVGALLAVLHDEDPRLGPGARARAFDFARPEFASLVAFLRAF